MASSSQVPDSGNHSRLDLPTLEADTLAATPGTAEFVEFLKHQVLGNPDNAWLWTILDAYTPEEHQAWVGGFMKLFLRERDTRFLECAVASSEHALDALPKNTDYDDQRFNHLFFMLASQGALAAELEKKEMHDDAIDVYERAVKAAPDSHPLTATLCIGLGIALKRRFDRFSKEEDLHQAIRILERGVACASADDSLRDKEEMCLWALSELLGARWKLTKDQRDLDHLGACATSVVTLDPSSLDNHICLGRALLKMADASTGQDTAYLSDLLRCSTIPLENLAELETALLHLFYSEHDMRSLDHIVATCEYAVSRYPDHDFQKFDHLYRLGDAFEQRGLYDNAIDAYEHAVSVAWDLTPLTCKCFSQLGLLLRDRFHHSQDPQHRDRAMWALEMAVACSPENARETYDRLLSDFQRDFPKDVDELRRMVACAESAVKLNPNEPANYMSLRDTLRVAYRYTALSPGGPSILSLIDSSILTIQNSLPHIPEASSAHARALCALGHSYHLRLLVSSYRDPTDTRLCIACFDKAETIQRLDVEELIDQGHALMLLGHLEYLTKAASVWDNLLSQEHVQGLQRFRVLLRSAGTKGSLYLQHGGDEVVLEQAIQAAEDACNSPVSKFAQFLAYHVLGGLLTAKICNAMESAAAPLEHHISVREKLLSLTPEDPHIYQMSLAEYGMSLALHERLLPSEEIRRRATETFRQLQAAVALRSDGGLVRNTVLALWASSAYIMQDWSSCMEAYHKLLENFEDLVWLGLSTSRQIQLILRDKFGVRTAGSMSARAAVCHGSIPTALEWLDQCRSIAWQKVLNLRVSTARLAHIAPDLALRLQTVSQTLDEGALQDLLPGLGDEVAYEVPRQQRHRAAEEWKHLIDKVRAVQGFESFLRPKTAEQLLSLNLDGYVVSFNLHDDGCDAFILCGGTADIQLCQLDPTRMNSRIAAIMLHKLAKTIADSGRSRGDESRASVRHRSKTSSEIMAGLLSDLWNSLVKPILDFIHLKPYNEGSTPPRLWWCPNGPLAFLPLHAAGLYDTSDRGRKVYEYVASSYTPTVSMLADKLDRQHPTDFKGLLAVSQPSGDPPIPKTVEEVESVVAIAKQHDPAMEILRLNDVDATAERVLDGMTAYSFIHLACHARQRFINPLDSVFMLSDRALRLSEIAARPLPHAELAFLSACQTATGVPSVMEEAVLLAAGMLVVGFRSVVATMWSVRDSDAPIVAEACYQKLFSGGKANVGMSGIALHHATMALRERIGVEDFMSWVPFVHFGA